MAASQPKVFYSWQSWRSEDVTRNVIEQALKKAIRKVARVVEGAEPLLDRDTKGLPGSPQIADAIREKIASCTAFVADIAPVVTLRVGEVEHAIPNPNVMLEVGCAVEHLGWRGVVLVFNAALGDTRGLPFDLPQHRILKYSLAERAADEDDATFHERRKQVSEHLAGALTTALQPLLAPSARPSAVAEISGLLFFGLVEKTSTSEWSVRLTAPIGGDASLDVVDLASRLGSARRQYVALSSPGVARELAGQPALMMDGDDVLATLQLLPEQPRSAAQKIGRDLDLESLDRGGDLTPGGVLDIPRRLSQTLSIAKGELAWETDFGTALSSYASDFDRALLPDLIALETAKMAHVRWKEDERPALDFIRRVNRIKIEGSKAGRLDVFFELDVEGVGAWSGKAKVFIPDAHELEQRLKKRDEMLGALKRGFGSP